MQEEELEVQQAEEPAQTAEPEESAPSEPEGEEPTPQDESPEQPKKSAKERIDELTYKRREEERQRQAAERERDYWRELAMRQAQSEPTPQPQQPKSYPDLPEPRSEEFDTYDAFVDARAKWAAQTTFRHMQEQQQAIGMQQTKRNWNDQGRTKYNDWDEVFNHNGVPVSDAMGQAMLDSPQGHELAYYLGKNPNEAYRIAALPAHRQVYELGKLETKLSGPPQRTKSHAPNPTSPVGGKEVPAKDPDKMSYEEFKAWREAGGGK